MLVRIIIVLCLFVATCLQAQDKSFVFKGSAAVGGFHFYQNIDRGSSSLRPYGASLSINARLGYGRFVIPMALSINNQGTDFSNPFNRFGISPTYRWIKLHLGWRTMRFSKFSMQNTQFLGAGLELNPGLLRLSAMKGKIDYRIPGLPEHLQDLTPQRDAMAVKLGFGSRTKYLDISLLRVEDERMSGDTIFQPKQNAVLGLQSQLSFWDNMIKLELDAGLSALTENTYADEELLDEADIPSFVTDIIEPNISTHVNYALEGKLSFQKGWFALANTYRRVMPEYQSLGLNYLRNDIEAFVVAPSFRLFANKLIISSSIGLERNNLDELRNLDQERVISSANVNIRPNQNHNINLQFSNYSFDQRLVYDSLLTESIIIQQVNRNYGASYTFTKNNKGNVNVLSISTQVQEATNLNESSLNNNTKSIVANYSKSSINSNWSYNLGANYFDLAFGENNSSQLGLNLGVSYNTKRNLFKTQLGGLQSISGQSSNSYFSRLSWRYSLTESLSMEMSSRLRLVKREAREDINTVRTDIRFLQRW